MDTRRKIIWHSNAPWAATGYGVQTAMFVPRLAELGYDMALSAFYGMQGAIGRWHGMPVYPSDHTHWTKHRLREYAAHFAGDTNAGDVLIITLQDVWTWIDLRFGAPAAYDGLNIASWVPVDHDPVPARVLEALAAYKARPIAMSEFGQEQIELGGRAGGIDFNPLYVPHGIETRDLQPRDRTLMRAGMKLPEDAFVIGMVANNKGTTPPRKSFPQIFQAFAKFCETHDDAFLYLHCEVFGFDDGVNLLALADICGIPGDRIGSVDQLSYHLGTIHPETMSYIYSAMDVLASPSYGEGFGIPIIEAQACGTPVIVSDWTAMPELCGAGWKVQGDRFYDASQGSFFMSPSVMEIYDAFEAAYQARGDQQLRAQAVEFAAAFDADLITEHYWKPALAAIEQQLDERTPDAPMPSVTLNREQRRRLERERSAS